MDWFLYDNGPRHERVKFQGEMNWQLKRKIKKEGQCKNILHIAIKYSCLFLYLNGNNYNLACRF